MSKTLNVLTRRCLYLPLLALACLLVADPAWAEWVSKTDQPGWLPFFGRLHLVVLHLPIGLLVGAFVLELLGTVRRTKGYDNAAAWTLSLGAISAWVACTTGWLYEETAGLTGLTLEWHKWLSIALAIVATIAAVLKIVAIRKQWKPAADGSGEGMHPGGAPLMLTRLGIVAIMVLLPVTGHLGGNMVHGQTELTKYAPFSVPDFVVRFPNSLYDDKTVVDEDDSTTIKAVSNSVADWNANIQPILDAKCIQCHSETKIRGEYRLDTLEWAMKEGEVKYYVGTGDPVEGNIIPGNVIESELWVRVALPEDHFDYMPNNGDPGFTAEEVQMLADWIRNFDGNLEADTETDPDAPAIAAGDDDDQPQGPATYDPLLARQIADAGAAVQPVSQEENPELMEVRFAYRSEPMSNGALKALEPAAGSIARLELQGSSVTDADLADLPAMPRLTWLNLKDTAITDAGIANLPEMQSIEWINLFGTQITDAALEKLAQYTSLEKVYLTGTTVTESGVATLRSALPEAEIFSDFDLLPDPSTPETEAPAEDAAADAAQEATPVNTACPVSGAAIQPGFTSIYEGKMVAFCCGNCKAKFDENPAAFADKLQ